MMAPLAFNEIIDISHTTELTLINGISHAIEITVRTHNAIEITVRTDNAQSSLIHFVH